MTVDHTDIVVGHGDPLVVILFFIEGQKTKIFTESFFIVSEMPIDDTQAGEGIGDHIVKSLLFPQFKGILVGFQSPAEL